MKKIIGALWIIMCISCVMGYKSDIHASVSSGDAILEIYNAENNVYNVVDYGADGTDTEDDSMAFINALAEAVRSEGAITVYVPAGVYYIGRTIPIYSDTTLTLDDNATIISTNAEGAMISARHLNAEGTVCSGDGTCNHGGYTQVQNITIQGGTWDRNDVGGEGISVIFSLRHGYNITIQNLVCKNASNHYINLSGVDTAVISHVVCRDQSAYRGSDPSFWGDYEAGDESRYGTLEAIHLDYLDEVGEGNAYPLDRTAPRNVKIQNCTFENLFAGIGTHHLPEGGIRADNIEISGNIFKNISRYCINAYGYDNMNVHDNSCVQIHSLARVITCNGGFFEKNTVQDARENGIYIMDGSYVTVRGNQITNSGSAGIRINSGCQVTAENNVISHPATHGISASGSTLLTAADNEISAAGENGLVATEQTTIAATGNIITDAGSVGIYINSCLPGKITGNRITASGSNGINVYISDGSIISENEVQSAGAVGISVYCSQDCEVTGNTITDSSGNGIQAVGSEEKSCTVKISGNTSVSSASANRDIRLSVYCVNCVVENNILGGRGFTADPTATYTASNNTVWENIDISACKITLSGNSYIYDGKAKEPGLTVTNGSMVLVEGKDYTVSYENNTEVGIGTVIVTGIGSYNGTSARSFSIQLAVPVLLSVSNKSEGVTVAWQTVGGADGYIIYRKESGGSWTKAGNVVGGNTASYTDTGACAKNSYCYTVRAYRNVNGSPVYGTYDTDGKSVTAGLAMVVLKNATSSAGQNKVTWNKVNGADGYIIYRKVSGENWITLASVKCGDTVSYTDDKDLTAGVIYFYTVRAYYRENNQNIYGSYDKTGKGVTASLATVALKSVTTKSGQNTVEWNKVNGADGYIVYRKTNGGSWSTLATLKGTDTTSYMDGKSLTAGVTYYYTVRAYQDKDGKRINGGYDSKGKGVAASLATVTLRNIATKEGQNIITWNKVNGAAGYVVYRRTEDAKWAALAVVKGEDTLSYTDNMDLTAGETYYYTVRAYQSVAGKTIYGGYDNNGREIVASIAKVILKNVTTKAGQNTITWNKVNGAEGYIVYRKEVNGKWTTLATLSGGSMESYTDGKNLTAGMTYYYTVRAYWTEAGKTINGSYDAEGKSVVTSLPTVVLKSVTAKAGQNTVIWNKVGGADGYVVYRKTGGAGWTKLTAVKGESVDRYVDSADMTPGQTYYYTVRAYCIENGKYIYGGYDTKGKNVVAR